MTNHRGEENRVINWIISAAILAMFAFGMCSCAEGYTIDYMPGQDKAIAMAAQVLEIDASALPPIEWVRGERLNCAHATGWIERDTCVTGTYRQESITQGPAIIQLAIVPHAWWADVPLAHELCHFRQRAKFGDSDAPHLTECFKDADSLPGAIDDGLTHVASLALEVLGEIQQDY